MTQVPSRMTWKDMQLYQMVCEDDEALESETQQRILDRGVKMKGEKRVSTLREGCGASHSPF